MNKPAKPRADFPLFAHNCGQWAKKVRGRMHYFGVWSDPSAAEALYSAQAADLHAGRKPRAVSAAGGLTVLALVNAFLVSKRKMVDSGEIAMRTWLDYQTTGQRLVDGFGRERLAADLAGDDFEDFRAQLAKGWGPVTLANEINRVRVVFKWAYDAGQIERPMRFGPGFKRPSAKVLRKERAKKGIRMFEAEDVRRLLGLSPWRAAAGGHLAAMILLGVNCGMGNADVGSLPLAAVNLETGWLDFPRPKTGIARRCKLWPETLQALTHSLEHRPEPKEEGAADRFFVTQRGGVWSKGTTDDPVCKEMRKLLSVLGMARPGIGFYALRHTFETVGGESRDQVAVNAIMGHAPASSDMSSVYREKISDDRLAAVSEHVHGWLFPSPASGDGQPAGEPQTSAGEASEADGDSEPRILRMRRA
jgi:integrase